MDEFPFQQRIEKIGRILVTTFHLVALFVIGGTIVRSAAVKYPGKRFQDPFLCLAASDFGSGQI